MTNQIIYSKYIVSESGNTFDYKTEESTITNKNIVCL